MELEAKRKYRLATEPGQTSTPFFFFLVSQERPLRMLGNSPVLVFCFVLLSVFSHQNIPPSLPTIYFLATLMLTWEVFSVLNGEGLRET